MFYANDITFAAFFDFLTIYSLQFTEVFDIND